MKIKISKPIYFQIFISLFLGLFTYNFSSIDSALSSLIGCTVVLINFYLLYAGWSLIFKQKLVGLAGSIIVFKYAILGIIIYTISKVEWFSVFWFCIGISSFMITAIYFAIINSKE